MSGTTTWVSHHRKCHICGKEDYCKYGTFDNGDTLEYCHRKSGSKGVTIVGVDGNIYRWSRETDWGFHVWEPQDQYARNRAAYLESLGIKEKHEIKPSESISVANTQVDEKLQKKYEPEVKVTSPAKLDKVYRYFSSLLKLEEFHKNALISEWGEELGQSILREYTIFSLPPEDKERSLEQYRVTNLTRAELMKRMESQFTDLKGVPGFYLNDRGHWDIISSGGIIFPVYNSQKQIISLRIGEDHPKAKLTINGKERNCFYKYGSWGYWEDGNFIKLKNPKLTKRGYPVGASISGKYKNFSSSKTIEVDGIVKAKYAMTCSAGSQISLYGKDSDDWSVVYMTEGEKKAMVGNMVLGYPVISIPGVASFGKLFKDELGRVESMVDFLQKKGTRLFVIAYDADKKINQDVLSSEYKAVKAFIERGIYIAIAEWNHSWGKGLDDILIANIRPSIIMVTV